MDHKQLLSPICIAVDPTDHNNFGPRFNGMAVEHTHCRQLQLYGTDGDSQDLYSASLWQTHRL